MDALKRLLGILELIKRIERLERKIEKRVKTLDADE